jgi:hypothetical protein
MMTKLFSFTSLRVIACGLLLGCSHPLLAQDEDTPPPQRQASLQPPTLSLPEIPANEICWLTVDEQQVFSLYKKDLSGTAKGGVIILPGLNKDPFSPDIINGLRTTLAENEWHSLAVRMPANNADRMLTPGTNRSAEQEALEPNEDFATDEEATAAANAEVTLEFEASGANNNSSAGRPMQPLSPTEQHAQQIIAAAIQYFNNDGIFNLVLIGEGISAVHAAHYLANMPAVDKKKGGFDQIRAFAMINARNRIDGSELNLAEELAEIDMPMIDLYFGLDYRDGREAKARKKVSRGFAKGQYMQLKLPLIDTNWQNEDDWLTKRIRGWLDRRAAGFEVDAR